MRNYDQPLLPDHYYHIFNRAVGSEKLFNLDKNYHFFLQRFRQYILPIADIFCYALLPNHFHFFLRMKSLPSLEAHYLQLKKKPFKANAAEEIQDFAMEQFSNWCNSYTKSFNRSNGRMGKLFMEKLNRNTICSQSYYSAIVFYIHNNPVKHNIRTHMIDWPFSSYNLIVADTPCWLQKDELLEWFGGMEGFLRFHQQP